MVDREEWMATADQLTTAIIAANEQLEDVKTTLNESEHVAHRAVQELRYVLEFLMSMMQAQNTMVERTINVMRKRILLLVEHVEGLEKRLDEG